MRVNCQWQRVARVRTDQTLDRTLFFAEMKVRRLSTWSAFLSVLPCHPGGALPKNNVMKEGDEVEDKSQGHI